MKKNAREMFLEVLLYVISHSAPNEFFSHPPTGHTTSTAISALSRSGSPIPGLRTHPGAGACHPAARETADYDRELYPDAALAPVLSLYGLLHGLFLVRMGLEWDIPAPASCLVPGWLATVPVSLDRLHVALPSTPV